MKTTKFLNKNNLNDIAGIIPSEKFIFLDIETTGLSPKNSMIYLIGTVYLKYDLEDNCEKLCASQYFAQSREEEKEILSDFNELIMDKETIIHFNGNSFDIPFILERCRYHNIPIDFTGKNAIDIYRRLYPFKHILKLNSCRQKDLEVFLKINREDKCSGKELIKVYRDYIKDRDYHKLKLLTIHNFDDITGMLKLLPLLSYTDFFYGEDLYVKKAIINNYRDYEDYTRKELLIYITLPKAVPVPVAHNYNDIYLSVKDNEAVLKIPVYTEDMKLFYNNYKDYYYLPLEDMAVHKSVSQYVDREFREKATAKNCYTHVSGEFLPQFSEEFLPVYKREYESERLFFKPGEEFKKSRNSLLTYVRHILQMMVKCK